MKIKCVSPVDNYKNKSWFYSVTSGPLRKIINNDSQGLEGTNNGWYIPCS
jgi:hypothetical protein